MFTELEAQATDVSGVACLTPYDKCNKTIDNASTFHPDHVQEK